MFTHENNLSGEDQDRVFPMVNSVQKQKNYMIIYNIRTAQMVSYVKSIGQMRV